MIVVMGMAAPLTRATISSRTMRTNTNNRFNSFLSRSMFQAVVENGDLDDEELVHLRDHEKQDIENLSESGEIKRRQQKLVEVGELTRKHIKMAVLEKMLKDSDHLDSNFVEDMARGFDPLKEQNMAGVFGEQVLVQEASKTKRRKIERYLTHYRTNKPRFPDAELEHVVKHFEEKDDILSCSTSETGGD